jgi:hypothetical protein
LSVAMITAGTGSASSWDHAAPSAVTICLPISFVNNKNLAKKPSFEAELWQQALTAAGVSPNGEIGALVEQFDLGLGHISRAVSSAREFAALRSSPSSAAELTPDDLWRACEQEVAPKLDELAQQIIACYGWDDIVLPPEPFGQLQEIGAHGAPRPGLSGLGLRRQAQPRPRHQRAVRRRQPHRQDPWRRKFWRGTSSSTCIGSTSSIFRFPTRPAVCASGRAFFRPRRTSTGSISPGSRRLEIPGGAHPQHRARRGVSGGCRRRADRKCCM